MSNQKPRTIDEQIRLFRSRGMAFGNEEEARRYSANISYFRLKYYWTDMRDEETEHDFKEGALFDDVIGRYNFDRRLNIIAHHSRLWNRSLAKQVTNPKGHRDKWLQNPLTDNQKKKAYGVISAMLYLCNAVYPDNQIKDKLLAMIDRSTKVPYYKYGFVGDWRKEPIWC